MIMIAGATLAMTAIKADAFTLLGYVVAAGGTPATGITGAGRVMYGTIGQADASGALSGGNFSISGGFWGAPAQPVLAVPGDGNAGEIAEFSLGVHPNPTAGRGLNVAWSLPTAESARLDMLDVNGRRVVQLDVSSLGTGRHTLNLAAGHPVAPGIYWVRLTQGANRRSTRVAVME